MIGMTTIAPIAVMLVIFVTLIGFAYAEDITNVEVNTFPFEITLVEEGTVIITSDIDRTLRSDVSTIEVKAGEPFNLVLSPILDSSNRDGWHILDMASGEYSIIHTVDPYVEPPVYVAPVYVEPVYVAPVVAEPLEVVITEELTVSGINNVATYNGDVDALALQIALADVTANFNKSVEKIAEQKTQIGLLNANITSLQVQQQVVTVDTTELDNKVLALQANNTNLANDIVTITNDRDQWKTLAENWYGIAMEQLKVMVNILGL
jgi:hypothetical protein